MVCLAEAVDQRLPVARYRHRDVVGAVEVVDPRPLDVGGDTLEELAERSRVEVHVHEHERSPRGDLHGKQREVVVAERAEAFARRHLAEAPLQVPCPAVVAAPQLPEPPARAVAERVAAVAADVLKSMQVTVVAPHDEHGVGPEVVYEEVARRRHMVDGARDLPDVRPETLELAPCPLGRGVPRRGNARRCAPPGDARDRGPDGRLVGELGQRRQRAPRTSRPGRAPVS